VALRARGGPHRAVGPDALRVASRLDGLTEGHGALSERPQAEATVKIDGRARASPSWAGAEVDAVGNIRFVRAEPGDELLCEQADPLLVAGSRNYTATRNGYHYIEAKLCRL